MFDKQLPNSEPKLRAVFDKLTAKFGTPHAHSCASVNGTPRPTIG